MILAIDPSSTRTGYAVMLEARGAIIVVEAGYLKAERSRDEPIQRVLAMCQDLDRLIDEHDPSEVAIELPDRTHGKGSRKGASYSLIVYGMAVGAMIGWADRRCETCLVPVGEWTGREPKPVRTARVASLFPNYREMMGKDSGADVADAIGIGLWRLNQRHKLRVARC